MGKTETTKNTVRENLNCARVVLVATQEDIKTNKELLGLFSKAELEPFTPEDAREDKDLLDGVDGKAFIRTEIRLLYNEYGVREVLGGIVLDVCDQIKAVKIRSLLVGRNYYQRGAWMLLAQSAKGHPDYKFLAEVKMPLGPEDLKTATTHAVLLTMGFKTIPHTFRVKIGKKAEERRMVYWGNIVEMNELLLAISALGEHTACKISSKVVGGIIHSMTEHQDREWDQPTSELIII